MQKSTHHSKALHSIFSNMHIPCQYNTPVKSSWGYLQLFAHDVINDVTLEWSQINLNDLLYSYNPPFQDKRCENGSLVV